MKVTPRGFAEIAQVCVEAAEGPALGRVIFALEGGYDLEGLAQSAAAVARVMLGQPGDRLAGRSPRLDPLVSAYREVFAPFWPSVR
jgi:acetoin utilization deacetylase AcuC-like enzyme